jgi:hypothetical protein
MRLELSRQWWSSTVTLKLHALCLYRPEHII